MMTRIFVYTPPKERELKFMEILIWLIVIALILGFLLVDLGIFNRKPHKISAKEALITSTIWIVLAFSFNGFIWVWHGPEPALAFFTGYALEKMLSLDNMFVFVMIFQYFAVASYHQHRILFWGIIGAIIFRLIFILIGLKLIDLFEEVLYFFGALLIYSSYKMYWKKEETLELKHNGFVKWVQKWAPLKENYKGRHFFLYRDGKWYITPALLVLLTIEISDVIFAIDSIPAIFAITLDPFIVFTSNIFAICGLRSLYFLLAHSITRFYYLQHAISLILGFVGFKLILKDFLHIPIFVSLAVIFLTLIIAILFSMKRNQRKNLE